MLMELVSNSVKAGELINDAFQSGMVLGLIIGFAGLGFFFMLYWGMKNASLKRYMSDLDDSNRKEVMGVINNMGVEAEFLAMKTNTVYFKSLSNDYIRLVSFLKRRNIL